jgi:broad specificity phosphatase PhoE
MTQLILVRHSTVVVDPAVPAPQWRLSADGRIRCHQLAEQIGAYSPTRFVTSDEVKAVETGQLMAAHLKLPCTTAPNLHEQNRHGLPYFADKDEWATVVAQFFARPEQPVLGEETAGQARLRLEQAVDHLRQQYPDDRLALVTHGRILTAFISHHNPTIAPFSFWQSLTLPCAFILDAPNYRLQKRIYL